MDVEVPAAAATQALHQGGRYRVTYSIIDDRELERFRCRRIDFGVVGKGDVDVESECLSILLLG